LDSSQFIGVTRSVIVTDAANMVVDPGHVGCLGLWVVAPFLQTTPWIRFTVNTIAANLRLRPPVGDLGEGAGLRRLQYLQPERLAVFVLRTPAKITATFFWFAD